MKHKYAYPAVFKKEEKGWYTVNFPDLEDCFTAGKGIGQAIYWDLFSMIMRRITSRFRSRHPSRIFRFRMMNSPHMFWEAQRNGGRSGAGWNTL